MIEQTIQRAQVYYFLSHVFFYPRTSWLEEIADALQVLEALGIAPTGDLIDGTQQLDLADLQAQYREVFGLTGSQCYETEFGLPHEFRQSQELADIAGFYQAFGFRLGEVQRERPDHLSVELEFMYLLALKEALALENGSQEQAEICRQAQRHFLRDHLGRWIAAFNASLLRSSHTRLGSQVTESIYLKLAQVAEDFIAAELQRMDVQLDEPTPAEMKPTPYNPDYSCAGCAAAETVP